MWYCRHSAECRLPVLEWSHALPKTLNMWTVWGRLPWPMDAIVASDLSKTKRFWCLIPDESDVNGLRWVTKRPPEIRWPFWQEPGLIRQGCGGATGAARRWR